MYFLTQSFINKNYNCSIIGELALTAVTKYQTVFIGGLLVRVKGDIVCPVDGKCLSESVIYRATLTEENGTINTYVGLTCNTFKTKWNAHNHSFNNSEAKQTTLSSYIHEIKQKKIEYNLQWDLVSSAKPFNPVSEIYAYIACTFFFTKLLCC